MADDNEPMGIRQDHFDGELSIIGADGWPLSPEETAELFRAAEGGDTLDLLMRVRDALRALAKESDGAQ